MVLTLGVVTQICVYVLTGSAAGLTVLDWYINDGRRARQSA